MVLRGKKHTDEGLRRKTFAVWLTPSSAVAQRYRGWGSDGETENTWIRIARAPLGQKTDFRARGRGRPRTSALKEMEAARWRVYRQTGVKKNSGRRASSST